MNPKYFFINGPLDGQWIPIGHGLDYVEVQGKELDDGESCEILRYRRESFCYNEQRYFVYVYGGLPSLETLLPRLDEEGFFRGEAIVRNDYDQTPRRIFDQ